MKKVTLLFLIHFTSLFQGLFAEDILPMVELVIPINNHGQPEVSFPEGVVSVLDQKLADNKAGSITVITLAQVVFYSKNQVEFEFIHPYYLKYESNGSVLTTVLKSIRVSLTENTYASLLDHTQRDYKQIWIDHGKQVMSYDELNQARVRSLDKQQLITKSTKRVPSIWTSAGKLRLPYLNLNQVMATDFYPINYLKLDLDKVSGFDEISNRFVTEGTVMSLDINKVYSELNGFLRLNLNSRLQWNKKLFDYIIELSRLSQELRARIVETLQGNIALVLPGNERKKDNVNYIDFNIKSCRYLLK